MSEHTQTSKRNYKRGAGIARSACLAAICFGAAAMTTSAAHRNSNPATEKDWPTYANQAGGMRFSPLDEVNTKNVSGLAVAWEFHTGDISRGEKGRQKSSFESTPIVVDGTMYVSTPFSRVIALDPTTGQERWSYDPQVNLSGHYADGLINRGVSTWVDPSRKETEPCRRRIFIGTIDARLIALDAADGKLCPDFGDAGQIDLKVGIAGISYLGEYEETSPPTVIDDMVVVGSGISDNERVNMPSGVVRAFDARTGKLRWSWEPIPPNKTASLPKPGDKSAWYTGAANAWAPMAVDEDRDLVFVPTGSASPDYWGGFRPGDDKWADSVVALRGKTGEFVWGFQLVHHDLWDYDSASQPILATIRHEGRDVPVVIQGNKTGMIYVLNRDTGKPVFPVIERPVPQSHVAGEVTSPTQPFPTAPPPLVSQTLTADQVWKGLPPRDRAACREEMSKLEPGRVFTPPSVEGIVAIPGNAGGLNWSGGAFDPEAQIYVAYVINVPFDVHLVRRDERLSGLIREVMGGSLRAELAMQIGAPFAMTRIPLLTSQRLPCGPPPWGALVAVKLSTGKIAWRVPLGTTQDLILGEPPRNLGIYGFGGTLVTAGKLVFVSGAIGDNYLRAFDINTGKMLWQGQLPAGGQAAPMTYRIHGKQYIVIAAGGHGKLDSKQGDSLVAFALH